VTGRGSGAFADPPAPQRPLSPPPSPSTRKARNIARNPSVVVHTESGDEVVILEGTAAQFHPSAALGTAIARAFADKYEGYEPDPAEWAADGSLYSVEPSVVFAWHDMPTATCWRFRR
jgi:hypothetical protein